MKNLRHCSTVYSMLRIRNLRFLIALISIAIAGLLVLPEKVAKSHSTNAAQSPSPMAGDLDSTFALDGTILTGFGTADDFGRATAIQADGKIVVAGYATNVSPQAFAVARYNTDGTLDPTFKASGEVFTSIFNNTTVAYAVAIQPDGKIVAAGTAPTSGNGDNQDFAVVRYNANGLLDTTFNSTGKVTTPIGGFSGDGAYAVAIQSDGKIVAAGETVESGNHHFAVVRYNPDGSLDTTFNQTGKLTTSLGVADAANAVKIQTDGKIVVAGGAFNGVDGDFALVRYNPDGSLDTSFGSSGTAITAIGTGNDVITAAALQADGKIVVAGYAGPGPGRSSNDFAVARYNSDGSLDTTFNGTGKATTDFPDPFNPINDFAYAVAIQADGKIVAAGMSGPSVREDFAVVRYNVNGSLDTSLNSTGRVLTPIGNMTDAAYAVAIQTDGKIVTAGTSRDDSLNQGGSSVADNDFVLVRYNSDGTLDTAFDADGIRLDDFGNRFAVAGSTAIQTDGKIVVAGYSYGFSASGVAISVFSVVRYNPDGTLDRSFNGGGKVTTPIGEANGYAYAVALQPDGKIVVTGAAFSNSNGDFALVRYNTDGSLDTSFNSTGIVTTAIGSGTDEAFAVAIEPGQGRIVAAGRSHNGSYFDFALVRYNADGSLDSSFNSSGKVTTPVGTGGAADAYAVKLQSDGKIVAAGNAYGPLNFAVVRYNTDGSLDPTFNGTGIFLTWGTAKSLAIQADGKIVAAGYASGSSSSNVFAIYRLNTDGSYDTSFNSTGQVLAPVGQAYAVAIQSDGKVVAAGYSNTGQTLFGPSFGFTLARYNADGSLDTLYGTGGKVVLTLTGVDTASTLALDARDRAVVAGYAGGVFGVARIVGRQDSGCIFSINPTAQNFSASGGTGTVNVTTTSACAWTAVSNDPWITVTSGSSGSGNGTVDYSVAVNPGPARTGTMTIAEQTFTVVNAGNNPPVAANDSFSTNEDTALTVAAPGVLGNDSDADGNPLSAVLVAGPSRGLLTLNGNGSFAYTPNADFNGTDSFTYKASDGTATSNTATVMITVNSVNDAPNAVDDSATTNQNTAIAINVLSNDSDVDGDTMTVSGVTQGVSGSVVINPDNTLTYAPNTNFSGADSFTYTASDGRGGATTATVRVMVNRVGQGCTRTQGYWQNHEGAWPVNSLTLGRQNYTKAELLSLLRSPSREDASIILAKQHIAVKLNIAAGADASVIASTVMAADDWLALFNGKLPYGVKTSSAQGQTAVNLANAEDQYNNGVLPNGPPHCDLLSEVFLMVIDLKSLTTTLQPTSSQPEMSMAIRRDRVACSTPLCRGPS